MEEGKKQVSLESDDYKCKHKWYDVIVAWANGEKIQYNFENLGWKDYCFGIVDIPGFNNADTEWRIKPKTVVKKYRMALVLKEDGIQTVEVFDVTDHVFHVPFVRWIGDTTEVEITCD